MKKPDFFITGLPKCGTTTLYTWLQDHPDIFMPESKEPHFFTQNLSDRYVRVREEDAYLSLFQPAKAGQICGEASVLYSFFPESLETVLRFKPDAKMIFMLRNPVRMVISYHGQLLVNLEEEIEDFEKAWSLQEARAGGQSLPGLSTDPALLQYKRCCDVGRHLNDFLRIVPESQRLILYLDDLAQNPVETYQETLTFLDVRDDGRRDFPRLNESAILKSRGVQNMILNPPMIVKLLKPFLRRVISSSTLHKLNRKKKSRVVLSRDFERYLYEEFEDSIRMTETLLKRDFSIWRKDFS